MAPSKRIPAMERIARRSVFADRGYQTPCRIFTGCLLPSGYGLTHTEAPDGSLRKAVVHRVVYEHHHGPIPEGLQIDHLCRQRDCHEVTHLEAVTGRENRRRGTNADAQRARHAARTHCIRGHEFTEANTIVTTKANGYVVRNCRTCRRRADRERKRQMNQIPPEAYRPSRIRPDGK